MSAAERPLRVLITNRVLANRTGTEIYVRDLALSLQALGHRPIVYSPRLGEVAAEVRAATVPVLSDLDRLGERPDIIHGHHAIETLAALMACPGVPAINVCHSWLGWADAPVAFPRVVRHVAVDNTCRDRLLFEHGLPEQRVHVLLNAVDLDRFRPRGPLPDRPKRALVYSNAAVPDAPHLRAIKQVCSAAGIAVDVAGEGSGQSLARPEDVLGQYDLVFAKGKAALEAAAVGTAVVLCDQFGAGPMIATRNLDQLRPLNFGMRALRSALTPEALAPEVARYDPADAAAVSAALRDRAGHHQLVEEIVGLYRDVLLEREGAVDDPVVESRAASRFLQSLAGPMRERDHLRGIVYRLLDVPLVNTLIRRRVSRPGHPLLDLVAYRDAHREA